MKPQSWHTIALVLIAGASVLLALGALFIDDYRDRFVYNPRERAAEAAILQIAEQQKALRRRGAEFVPFGTADVERDRALLGLNWEMFPTELFTFDAEALESGAIRLRALPRPDRVAKLDVRARLYLADLNPGGDVARAGWFPEN